MNIKPNASFDEMTSPFYLANENFCRQFEENIENKGGTVKGKYNAWSYLVYGKITTPRNWVFTYKKATFTSTGNLLVSSKYESLLVLAQWKTKTDHTDESSFTIRKKRKLDFICKLINSNLHSIKATENYIIQSKKEPTEFALALLETLHNLFISREIFKIEFKNNELIVELRTEKHHFELLDSLIAKIEQIDSN